MRIGFFIIRMEKISQNGISGFVPDPPDGLFDRIMDRVAAERMIREKRKRLASVSVTALSSLVFSLLAVGPIWSDISSSGFLRLVSLLFSDFRLVSVYWQNFGLSLLESLPVFGLISALALFILIVLLARSMVKNISLIKEMSARRANFIS